jgi:hypothetical protein
MIVFHVLGKKFDGKGKLTGVIAYNLAVFFKGGP